MRVVNTKAALHRLCDMRIPRDLKVADCKTIADIIQAELAAAGAGKA